MQTRTIVAKPLSCDNFSAFGDVIETSEDSDHYSINDGNTERYNNLATVEVGDGRTLVNIFRSKPLILSLGQPLPIKMMERHPLGSQAFMPLSDQPYLVVVAPKGELNTDLIEVFLASSHQGVNYHPGTWHHYCLALNQVSDFMVIDRGGEGNNCDVETLDGCIVIKINEQDK